jgi:hypothetical protein
VIFLAALLSLAQARPLAIVVGSFHQWVPCDSGMCLTEVNSLQHTDEDAWRWAFLQRARLPVEDILVFTELDETLKARNAMLGDAGQVPIAGLPTMAAIEAVLRARPSSDEPIELLLYFSSHGSMEGFHLEDQVIRQGAFIEKVTAALRAGPVTVGGVFADACYSGRSKSVTSLAPHGYQGVKAGNHLDVAVRGKTDEVQSIQGGQLSYWLRSALIGGADLNDDGLIAQEVLDFILSHPGDWGDPILSANGNDAPVALFDGQKTATYRIDNRSQVGQAARWYVSLKIGEGEQARYVPLADIFIRETPNGAVQYRNLTLPGGFSYAFWMVPYQPIGGDRYQRIQQGFSEGLNSWRCTVPLKPGQKHTAGCTGTAADIHNLLGHSAEAEISRSDRISRGIVEDLLNQHPRSLPAPTHALHWHNSRLRMLGWAMGAGVRVESNLFERAAQPAGLTLGASYTPDTGRTRLAVAISGLAEVRSSEPSLGRWGQLEGGLEWAAFTGLHTQIGLQVSGVGGLVHFLSTLETANPISQSAVFVGADFGPAITLRRRRWALTLTGSWAPRFVQVQDDALTATGEQQVVWEYNEGARWSTTAQVRYALAQH